MNDLIKFFPFITKNNIQYLNRDILQLSFHYQLTKMFERDNNPLVLDYGIVYSELKTVYGKVLEKRLFWHELPKREYSLNFSRNIEKSLLECFDDGVKYRVVGSYPTAGVVYNKLRTNIPVWKNIQNQFSICRYFINEMQPWVFHDLVEMSDIY